MKKVLLTLVLSLSLLIPLQAENLVNRALQSIAYLQLDEGHCSTFSPRIKQWITKNHCIVGEHFVINGQEATVLKQDEKDDLALLEGPVVTPLPLAKEEVKEGDVVVVFGWPLNWSEKRAFPSFGHTSLTNVDADVDGKTYRVNAFDVQAAPGESGGPVLNEKGEVAGVVDSVTISPMFRALYATPVKRLRSFLGMK